MRVLRKPSYCYRNLSSSYNYLSYDTTRAHRSRLLCDRYKYIAAYAFILAHCECLRYQISQERVTGSVVRVAR